MHTHYVTRLPAFCSGTPASPTVQADHLPHAGLARRAGDNQRLRHNAADRGPSRAWTSSHGYGWAPSSSRETEQLHLLIEIAVQRIDAVLRHPVDSQLLHPPIKQQHGLARNPRHAHPEPARRHQRQPSSSNRRPAPIWLTDTAGPSAHTWDPSFRAQRAETGSTGVRMHVGRGNRASVR